MLKVILEDLSDVIDPESGCNTGGGYAVGDEIHIDSNLPYERLRLTIVHEVLGYHLTGRVKHSKIDKIAIDIIDALMQIPGHWEVI